MTRGALPGRGFIEQNRLRFHGFHQLVATVATNVTVHALQREVGALVMIERRGLPLGTVVAISAGRDTIGAGKLSAVNVLMTVLAPGGRGAEVDIRQLCAHVRRFVTIDAGNGAMSAYESEVRLRMIKFCQVFPDLRVMADLATEGLSIRIELRHPLLELALVRIVVATLAS